MFRKLFSVVALELLVSAAVDKVIGDIIKTNVAAPNTFAKVLRLTGRIVIVSVITDYALDHVNKRVTAMKLWWEKRKEDEEPTVK